jgi:hypothetical protein
MKTVILVAPHFFPSFLPAVHRARLWATHLPDFGWKPIVVTTEPRYYECQIDQQLNDLLPAGLEVVRTRALPTKPLRIIGNLGMRAALWYYRAIRDLARTRRIDFVHITCDSFPAALIGPSIAKRLGIPYGIDYQDPWIPETPPTARFATKAWFAQRLSRLLEPVAVRDARLITGINERYFSSMLARNPEVARRAVTAGMAFGASPGDFEFLAAHPRATTVFDPADGNIHLFYAGALLPQANPILERFLESVQLLRERSEWGRNLRVHFVGTGIHESDPARGHTVTPYIRKWKLDGVVDELPSRIPYLDVLNHLVAAQGTLVIGSLEPHYSPSKIYQAALSGHPVLALLHAECSAASLVEESHAGQVLRFTPQALPEPQAIADALESLYGPAPASRPPLDRSVFDRESARESARLLAQALDVALARESSERRIP